MTMAMTMIKLLLTTNNTKIITFKSTTNLRGTLLQTLAPQLETDGFTAKKQFTAQKIHLGISIRFI